MIKQREANSWKSVSYAKSITGTQTYTKFPIVLRTTQQSIPTWNAKGNTETSGTPSPSSPITISGVGENTANLWDIEAFTRTYPNDCTYTNDTLYINTLTTDMYNNGITVDIPANTVLSYTPVQTENASINGRLTLVYSDNTTYDTPITNAQGNAVESKTVVLNKALKAIKCNWSTKNGGFAFQYAMINTGSTALPYEPFGYKIPLSSNGTALTPVYLSNQLMRIGDRVDTLASSGTVTYNIKKVVFDGSVDESWLDLAEVGGRVRYRIQLSDMQLYASTSTDIRCTHYNTGYSISQLNQNTVNNCLCGYDNYVYIYSSDYATLTDFKAFLTANPITVWYVLATSTTETVTVPSITTTSGLNTIDINTTVKPSEMSLTYNGYKICKQKKKSANLCNGVFEQNGINNAGDLVGAASRVRIFIDVKPNTQYTFNSNEYLRIIYGYNGDTKVGIILDTSENAPKTYTFTTAATVNKIGIALMNNAYSSLATAIVPSDVQNAILNTGSTALPYVPYWE